jgi:hypothetical protein
MRNLDDLESAWRAEHDQRTGLMQSLQTATRDGMRHANRMASSGDPMMNGFAVKDAAQYADQMGQRVGQAQDSYNSWAAGREVQHERNLMNAGAETAQYNAETARQEVNNKLAGQQALAGSISRMAGGMGGGSGGGDGGGGGNSASMDLRSSSGGRIGGGSVLGGLIEKPQQTQHSLRVNRR